MNDQEDVPDERLLRARRIRNETRQDSDEEVDRRSRYRREIAEPEIIVAADEEVSENFERIQLKAEEADEDDDEVRGGN